MNSLRFALFTTKNPQYGDFVTELTLQVANLYRVCIIWYDDVRFTIVLFRQSVLTLREGDLRRTRI